MRSSNAAVQSARRRLAAIGAATFGAGLVLSLAFAGTATAAPLTAALHPHQATTTTGGNYVPLTPQRLADTRPNSGEPGAGDTLSSHGTLTITMPSSVPAGATAVALNVTAVDATASGFLTVYPAGESTPLESVLNFEPGPAGCTTIDCVVPNLVISQLSSANQVTVYNGSTGTVNVVVDLEGYFDSPSATTGAAGRYVALPPARVADTRCGDVPPGAGSDCADEHIPAANLALSTMSGGQTISVAVAGEAGVPATGAEAAVVQLTATNTTANGYLTAYPGATSLPLASNVNWVRGQTASTRAIVPIGANGAIDIYNYAGRTDVVVDVVGYFTSSSSTVTDGALFTPIPPGRITDTRPGSGQANAGDTLGAGSQLTVAVAGASAGATTIPSEVGGNPTAAVLNVTEATATANSFLTVTPSAITPPAGTSDLNFSPGQITANADLATLSSSGTVNIYNYAGETNVVVDAFGYFTVPAPPAAGSVTGVTPTSGPPGTVVTGTVTDPSSVSTLTASGCGLSSQSVPFSSVNGAFFVTIPTSAPTGSCTLDFVATLTTGATVTTSVPFTVTSATPAVGTSVTFSPPTATLEANGTAQQAFTVTVTHDGSAVSGDAMTFTTTGASATGSCGTVDPTTATTQSNGTAVVVYTSSTTPGFCAVQGTEADTGASGLAYVTQTSGPVPSVADTVKVTADPSSVPAETSSTSTVTATVTNTSGAVVSGDVVELTLSADPAGSCGTVSPTLTTTNASGQATATYTASTTPGACTVTATEADTGASGTATVTQSAPAPVITVSANPSTLIVSPVLSSSSTVTATVTSGGAPVSGSTVTFTMSGSGLVSGCGTLSATSGTTDASGVVAVTYTSPLLSLAGSCTITATDTSAPTKPAAATTIDEVLNVT